MQTPINVYGDPLRLRMGTLNENLSEDENEDEDDLMKGHVDLSGISFGLRPSDFGFY